MLCDVGGIDTLAVWANAIEMLIDISDPIFPQTVLPFRCRQFIFQRRPRAGATTANSVESRCLAGLLVQVHLPQEIVDTRVDRRPGILVDIHAAVLV